MVASVYNPPSAQHTSRSLGLDAKVIPPINERYVGLRSVVECCPDSPEKSPDLVKIMSSMNPYIAAKHEAMERQLRSTNSELDESTTTVAVLQLALSKKDRQIKKLADAMGTRLSAQVTKLTHTSQKLRDAESEVKVLKARLEDKDSNRRLSDQNKQVAKQDSDSSLARLHSQRKQEKLDTNVAVSGLETRLRAQVEKLEAAQYVNRTLDASLAEMSKRHSDALQFASTLEVKLADNKAQNDFLEIEVKDAREQIAQLETELDISNKKRHTLMADVSNFKADALTLKSSKARSEALHETLLAQIMQGMEQKRELQLEVQDQKLSLHDVILARDEEITRHAELLAASRREVAVAQARVAAWEQKSLEMASWMSTLRGDNNTSKSIVTSGELHPAKGKNASNVRARIAAHEMVSWMAKLKTESSVPSLAKSMASSSQELFKGSVDSVMLPGAPHNKSLLRIQSLPVFEADRGTDKISPVLSDSSSMLQDAIESTSLKIGPQILHPLMDSAATLEDESQPQISCANFRMLSSEKCTMDNLALPALPEGGESFLSTESKFMMHSSLRKSPSNSCSPMKDIDQQSEIALKERENQRLQQCLRWLVARLPSGPMATSSLPTPSESTSHSFTLEHTTGQSLRRQFPSASSLNRLSPPVKTAKGVFQTMETSPQQLNSATPGAPHISRNTFKTTPGLYITDSAMAGDQAGDEDKILLHKQNVNTPRSVDDRVLAKIVSVIKKAKDSQPQFSSMNSLNSPISDDVDSMCDNLHSFVSTTCRR